MAGDFSNQFFPFRAFEAREWAAGRIPLWNPDMFGGHPFEADIQTAVFYPFALLDAVLLGRRGLPYFALEGEVILHTWLAGVFMYLLAARATRSRLGALVAGVAFGFGGFITTYPAQQLAVLETAIWLPLIVLCLHRATERTAARGVSWPWLGGAAASFGMALLAGHTQTALFDAYAAGGYLLFRLIRHRVALPRAAGALALFPVFSGLVAAIQLLPSLELLQYSTRDQMDYAAAAHAYEPSSLWQVFVPLWHDEKALSIGVVGLALAVVGAWASRRESLVYWTVAGLVALPLSTGGATPLFWVLYHVAPGWNLFRDQERVIYVFSFAAALLAARGVAELSRGLSRPSAFGTWIKMVAGGAALAVVLAAFAPRLGAPDGLRANLVLDAVVLAILAAVVYLARRRGDFSFGLAGVVVVIVVAEAFAINFGNNLSAANPDPRPRLEATAAYVRGFAEPFRVASTGEQYFPENYGALLGVSTVGGDTPFELKRMHDLITPDTTWRLWQILNVKYVVGEPAPTDGLKLVFQDTGLKTYFMQDSLPRAWAVRAVEVARNADQARQLILAPGYHPGNVVVLEQTPSIGPFVAGPRPDVQIADLGPQRIVIDANAADNAMLVIASQYYPGWQAYRDGQPVQVFQANDVAMAAELPPGRHHYEIVYRPTTFYVGATLSALALTVLGAVALRRRRVSAVASTLQSDRVKGLVAVGWWPAVAVVVLLGLAVRLHTLGAPNLTGDEWFMLRNHDEGPAWIIHQARTFEPHPLLYYLGLAGWIELAGRSEFALRFPSVVFGTLLVVALVGLGRAIAGGRLALLAGLLGAINPYQIAESQNARNYEMVAALSALATLLLLRALRRGDRAAWIAYGAAMLLALNTHYDALLVFAAHLAYLAYTYARSFRLGKARLAWDTWGRRAALTGLAVAVPFAAMVVYALPGLTAYHGYFPTPVGPAYVLARSLATFSLGPSSAILRAAPLLALAAAGVAWLAWRRLDRAVFLALYTLLPVAGASVLFAFRPMFDERYLIVLAPGFLLLVAAGVEAFFATRRAWPIGALAAVGAVALTASTLPGTYAGMLADRGDYRGLAGWVDTFGLPGDPIVATGHGQAELFSYYHRGAPVQIVDQPADLATTLPDLLKAHTGLWLLPYWNAPSDVAALDLLGRDAVPVAEKWFNNVRALYYVSPDTLTQPSDARGSWDDVLALTGAKLTGGEVQPGGGAGAELSWTVAVTMPTPKLSLRLLDDSGAIVAQHDAPLSGTATLAPGAVQTRLGLLVPPIAPPGRYVLAVLLYRPDSGAPLRLAADHPAPDNVLALGTIAVGARDRPVPVDQVDVPTAPPVDFPSGISLVGHDPLPGAATSGDWIAFRVLWHADRSPLPRLLRVVEFRDSTGHVVAQSTADVLPTYPTASWHAGQLLAERARIQVPPTLASGSYELALAVGGTSGPAADLGALAVGGPPRSFDRPGFKQTVNASFGSFAKLVGLDPAPASAARNDHLNLTLVWQARASADRSYTVFVHLVGPDGRIHGQIDRPPITGTRPTDGWAPGEYLRDAYDPQVPPDAPPGRYQIEVGLYDPASGARVPVGLADGSTSDHVVVGSFEVRP